MLENWVTSDLFLLVEGSCERRGMWSVMLEIWSSY